MTAPNRDVYSWDTPDSDPRVENAAKAIAKAANIPWNFASAQDCRTAARAALPFLAPQPSADADEIACNLLDICPSQWPLSPRRARYRDMIAPALAAVRAQATLAERERDGTWEQLARLAGEQLKSANSALAAKDAQIAALREAAAEVDGCFEAALCEGWIDAIENGDLERIRDIWYRRISLSRSLLPAALEMSGGVL